MEVNKKRLSDIFGRYKDKHSFDNFVLMLRCFRLQTRETKNAKSYRGNTGHYDFIWLLSS